MTRRDPAAASSLGDTDALGEAIAALAARIHAATYELLVMLREFDARGGWNTGFMSCAHWLHWRTGIDLGAAREKVRTARALEDLPRIAEAMRRGRISFAKVRALTRVARPETEAALLDVALDGTAAQVERVVRAWRRIDAVAAAQQEEARHLSRSLSTWVDEDGMVVIRGRLSPELGAVVMRALEAAAERLYREAADAPPAGGLAGEVSAGQRRADALGMIAEAALAAQLDRGTAGDRFQVVVHVDAAAAPAPAGPGEAARAEAGRQGRPNVAEGPSLSPGGTLELDAGAVDVSAETSRRLACDASVVTMAHGLDGATLDVGRKVRTIPPAIRRALANRDRHCRFPGCHARRCDAHHVEHWADGGATRLANLLLLCRRHHRLVHEGGVAVTVDRHGAARFVERSGRLLASAPSLLADAWGLDEHLADVMETPAVWDGTRFDLVWVMDVLYRPPAASATAPSSVRPGSDR